MKTFGAAVRPLAGLLCGGDNTVPSQYVAGLASVPEDPLPQDLLVPPLPEVLLGLTPGGSVLTPDPTGGRLLLRLRARALISTPCLRLGESGILGI